jgi:hypothetical protein
LWGLACHRGALASARQRYAGCSETAGAVCKQLAVASTVSPPRCFGSAFCGGDLPATQATVCVRHAPVGICPSERSSASFLQHVHLGLLGSHRSASPQARQCAPSCSCRCSLVSAPRRVSLALVCRLHEQTRWRAPSLPWAPTTGMGTVSCVFTARARCFAPSPPSCRLASASTLSSAVTWLNFATEPAPQTASPRPNTHPSTSRPAAQRPV